MELQKFRRSTRRAFQQRRLAGAHAMLRSYAADSFIIFFFVSLWPVRRQRRFHLAVLAKDLRSQAPTKPALFESQQVRAVGALVRMHLFASTSCIHIWMEASTIVPQLVALLITPTSCAVHQITGMRAGPFGPLSDLCPWFRCGSSPQSHCMAFLDRTFFPFLECTDQATVVCEA